MTVSISVWRYISALGISTLGILISYVFLKPDALNYQNTDSKPIASLVEMSELVEKKAVNGIAWQVLDRGADLYQGEMIRTGQSSSAKVQFKESGSSIEIDSDSMVVIELASEKFSLNVLEGSLFVEKGQGGGEFELKSGDKKVSLSEGQLSISKRQGSDFEVNVLQGEARAESSGKSVDLTEGTSAIVSKEIKKEDLNLNITFPSFGQVLYLKEREKLNIKWVPFKGDYIIRVLMGKDKSKLKPVNISPVSPEAGELSFTPQSDLFYWKLEALSSSKKDKPVSSPVFKNRISYLRSPLLLNPTQKKTLEVLQSNFEISFLWSGSNSNKYRFELAKDKDFKKMVDDEDLENVSYTLKRELPSGLYYWRVLSLYPQNISVPSEVRVFRLKVKELFAPKLAFPEKNYKAYDRAGSEHNFEWEGIPGIKEYIFKLERSGKELVRRTVKRNRITLKLKKLGVYNWSVASVDQKGKTSDFSELRNFSLSKLPRIKFINLEPRYFYTGENLIKLEWEKVANDFKGDYLVKIWTSKSDVESRKTSNPFYSFLPEKEGKYRVKVTAFDSYNKVVSISDTKEIYIKRATTLPAPQIIIGEEKDFLEAPNGRIRINLEEQSQANSYFIHIKDTKGGVVYRKKSRKPAFSITKLLPGRYYVEAQSSDTFERKSEMSESVEIVVPDQSTIKAPILKKVRIK